MSLESKPGWEELKAKIVKDAEACANRASDQGHNTKTAAILSVRISTGYDLIMAKKFVERWVSLPVKQD